MRFTRRLAFDENAFVDYLALTRPESEHETRKWASAWDMARATPDQARSFIGDHMKHVIFIPVDDLRRFGPMDRAESIDSGRTIDVVWDCRTEPNRDDPHKSEKPGGDGHCGITGLATKEPATDYTRMRKAIYKFLSKCSTHTFEELPNPSVNEKELEQPPFIS
ncbi:hypothetical protein EON81_06545 [bacterium]|nr:MAG: hypothetical protein EON81_06545 [bacterium]